MLSVRNILEATSGSLVSGGACVFTGVSIDSRTIKEGELFIPVKGEKFDGHDFVAGGLGTGSGVLVNREWLSAGKLLPDCKPVIAVSDTLLALHDLARYIRMRLSCPVISVVGSNGKTTTKELISSILSTRMKVLKTEGNLNNHIGMPLSIAGASGDIDAMVLEMGTNRPGEIDTLCRIALPDTGVITNIGMEHLEGFGSMDAVIKEEFTILKYVRNAALNGDDEYILGGRAPRYVGETIFYGIDRDGDIRASAIAMTDEGASFLLSAGAESVRVESKLSGRFNIYNSLAAAAVAHGIGFSLIEIKKGLEAFAGMKMRFEIRRHGGVTYIYDVYNANPSSMAASILELARVAGECPRGGRSFAVLGDMLELGDFSISAHEGIAALLLEHKIGHFIGVGSFMSRAVSSFGSGGIRCENQEDAGVRIAGLVRPGDVVLIKGSRGMKMERVMEVIESGVSMNNILTNTEGRK
jgi:UDP-N-acetylmuramoyl-tripeptide--D-alanyl-D-alanine ligase